MPPIPATVWQRLPEAEDGLEKAAAAYYGTSHLLPVAGSQAAIQALPLLREPGPVGVLHPGYAEHAHAWQRAGHQVEALATEALNEAVDRLDTLVLIHPNNPTGQRFEPATLLDWRARLAARGGWLVVDEAFMDATPEDSLAGQIGLPGLIVLRSLGKFFGLAGARVGFTLAEPAVLERLREALGPWTVSGPARWVAAQALQDQAWQEQMQVELHRSGKRLADLLKRQGLPVAGGTGAVSVGSPAGSGVSGRRPWRGAGFWCGALPIRRDCGLDCRVWSRPGGGWSWRWPGCGRNGCNRWRTDHGFELSATLY